MHAKILIPVLLGSIFISGCGGGGSTTSTGNSLHMTPYVANYFQYLSTTENVVVSRGTDTILITAEGTEHAFGLKASDIDAYSPNGEFALAIGATTVTVSNLGSIQSFPLPAAPAVIFKWIDNEGNVYGTEDRFAANSNQQTVMFRTKNGIDKETSTLPNGFAGYYATPGVESEISTLFIGQYQGVNHLMEFRPNAGAIDLGGLGSYFGGVYSSNSKMFEDGTTFGIDANHGNTAYLGRMGGPYRALNFPTINGRQIYARPTGFWHDGRMVFSSQGGILATETGEYERIYTKIDNPEFRYQIGTLEGGRGSTIVLEMFDLETQKPGIAILRQK